MHPISLDGLAASLDLGRSEHVAIVGGGGKTTLLHALAQQLSGRRLVTTTTKMGHDQDRGLPVLIRPSDAEISAIDRTVMVWSGTRGQTAVGVEPADCDRWFGLVDHVLVEADGSRRRPFKAPAHYEPVIGSTATTVASVIGADALGWPIERRCHRPELVAALAGCGIADDLTPERAAIVLRHEKAVRASVPSDAHLVVVVTKVDEYARPEVDELRKWLTAAPWRPGVGSPLDSYAIAHHDVAR